MARTQRPFEIMQVAGNVTYPVADNGNLVFQSLIVPEAGALIREAGITVTTAGGAGTATFVFFVEEQGQTVALTSTSAAINTDEPQYFTTSVKGPAGGGAGAPATTKGRNLAHDINYDAGTVGTAAVLTAWVFWQM